MKSLKLVRVFLAIAFFACANLFFFGLVSWASLLFKLQLLPSVLALNLLSVGIVLGVTLLFGRIYCSVVCPMGVFQDLIIWLRRRLAGSKRRIVFAPVRRGKGIRLVSLLFSAVLIAVGFVSLGALLDGYSLYGRVATQLFKPAYSFVQNLVAVAQANAGHPWLFREEVFVRSACALTVASVGLLGVVALAWFRGRFFCNSLCPVGAALSLVATRPVVKLAIDPDKCVSCGLCAATCSCGAIDAKAKTVDNPTCVRCFNCLSVCRKKAIGLKVR